VSRFQVSLVEARSRIEQTESRLTHLNEITEEIRRTVEDKTTEIEQAKHEIESTMQRSGELEAKLKSTFERRSSVSSRQSELRTLQSELLQRLGDKEKELKLLRAERENLGNRRHEKEMRLNTLESEIKAISERVRDEYEVEIAEIEVAKPNPETEDEDAVKLLTERKEKLRNFGAVNLLALEEYRQAADREKFLGEQLADLNSARTDLQTTISRINHTARRLFSETFEKVRSNFKQLFVELFSGGEADIRLIDPDDPLESDIEITARPRGKKILSITMMSGGERALTAISLLFSLYMVKPSPFCILDEIDAPLDDANCRRFLRIIDTFSEQTQFIIITHNKITMEAADNLYGVTMGQPGISQLVAVRFSEDDDGRVVTDTERPIEIGTRDEETGSEEQVPSAVRDRMNAVPSNPDAETED
jgi:chromosome segregation protein